MRNNFLEKSYTKYGGETIPKTFSENSNLGILWTNSLRFYTGFIVCQIEGYENILKLSCRAHAFNHGV